MFRVRLGLVAEDYFMVMLSDVICLGLWLWFFVYNDCVVLCFTLLTNDFRVGLLVPIV